MFRLFLSLIGLLGLASIAGGVLHLAQMDERGEMHLRPTIDRAALEWYVDRARALIAPEPREGARPARRRAAER